MADLTEDQMVAIAMQLCARVRDDHPEANGRWLTAVAPDPQDWFRLLFIVAAAVPDDRRWSELTGWVHKPGLDGLQRCGTRSAYERHKARGEDIDEACHEAYRAYAIVKQVKARRPKPVDKPVDDTAFTVDSRNAESVAPQGIHCDEQVAEAA